MRATAKAQHRPRTKTVAGHVDDSTPPIRSPEHAHAHAPPIAVHREHTQRATSFAFALNFAAAHEPKHAENCPKHVKEVAKACQKSA